MNKLRYFLPLVAFLVLSSNSPAQVPDISGLLNQLLGGGTIPGLGGPGTTPDIVVGDVGAGEPGTTPDGQEGDVGGVMPQENVRRFRERSPGLRVKAGIARYIERTANVGRLGPSTVEPPAVDESPRVMPVIVSDLLGGFFDLFNQIINSVNLLTSIQLGTLGSGTGGSFNLNQLLQQLLGSTGARPIEAVEDPKFTLPAGRPTTSVVAPPMPSTDPSAS